jgi:hypothetical protein
LNCPENDPQMVGHRTGGAYNGQNTPITGFERSVGGGI